MPAERTAYFLIGPTAVGKTDIAHQLALESNRIVLSADSMLVYCGMNIGTAKPSNKQQDEVRYGGINLVEPNQNFSTGDYLKSAQTFLKADKETIVVGGTGLYVKCLLQGLDEMPAANPEVRVWAEKLLQEKGLEALQEEVQKKDAARYEALADKKNPRRLIRALELAQTPLSKTWKQSEWPPIVGLRMNPDLLKQRIRQRVEAMYANGLLDEAKTLILT